MSGQASQQIIVAVVGMHRSGTSLIAEAIRGFDVATGPNLIVADAHNQFGYGEDATVVRLHNNLLHGLDRGWNTLRGTFPLPADWTERPEFETARTELAKYLKAEFARVGGRVWAVKDPRMSILLPLWFRLEQDLGFKLVIVLSVRNAAAVAASVARRDGIPEDLASLIWLEYNAAIATHAASRVQAVLHYDTWFNDPERNLALLEKAVGQPVDDAARDKILHLVNSELRHQAGANQEGVFARWQSLLDEWAQTQRPPAALSDEAVRVADFLAAFAPWRVAVTDQSYLMSMIDSREKEIRALVEVADRHLEAFRIQDQLFKEAREAIGRLEREREELLAVAARHLEAFRTQDQLFKEARDAIGRLERHRDDLIAIADQSTATMREAEEKYERLLKRIELIVAPFSRFPFTVLFPELARRSKELIPEREKTRH